jgi:archaemetzincin
MRYLYVGTMACPEEAEAVAAMTEALTNEFGVPTRTLDLPAADFAYDPARGQYGSIAILEMLARLCPEDAWKLLAVTTRDLFIPVLTFVFGQAQLGGRVGVVSLARLKQEFYGLPPNRDVFLDRASKEALHETGHLFGLVHCGDHGCAMSLSTGVRQIDLKQAKFCSPCRGRIAPARKAFTV